MPCYCTNHVFHWRKQTLGSLVPKFQVLATNQVSSFASHQPCNWLYDWKHQHPPPKAEAMTAPVRLKLEHLTANTEEGKKKKKKKIELFQTSDFKGVSLKSLCNNHI